MIKDATASEYQFGDFRLLPAQRALMERSATIKLGARAFDVLLALVERRDSVVSKHELMDRVWTKLVVEENNLQVQIVALRKVLGPQAIATVPGRGYRFTMSVQATGAAIPMSAVVAEAAQTKVGIAINADGNHQLASTELELTNLPRRAPQLFGREADITRVRALLAERAVVTIAGAGGIGKTRLAQAVAHEIAEQARDNFADGIWLVELAALSDGELAAAEVARVLGVPRIAGRSVEQALAAALRSQSLLLVLDNCEHVLQPVASLVDALMLAAPAVRILVTSQEPLKTAEEHVYRLDTLAVPAVGAAADISQYGAVQLFIERAQAADPRFSLTQDNAVAVAEICRRLDGIPLALELAAARVPLLGIDGLRARLDKRLQILTGGSRFVLRRHQTLRAALDFSHTLLSVEERLVFRRLGVFAGSFNLDAAQDVIADSTIDSWAVLDHLGALVDKSLVVAEGDKLPRLRLLETTRAYALEKLADAEETSTLLARHAHAIAKFFAQVYEEFWRLSDADMLARYEPELDNLRAALAWSLPNDPELAISIAGDSRPLWLELGLQPEALPLCEAAIAQISAATPKRAAGRLWHALAAVQANPRPAQSHAAALRAVELLRETNDAVSLGAALMGVAMAATSPPSQQEHDAVEELQRLDNPRWTGRMRLMLPNAQARINRAAGKYEEAMRYYELTRDLSVRCEATLWELASQGNVADMALIMGDIDFAIDTYRELVRRQAGSHDKLFYMYSLGSLATALLFNSMAAAARESLSTAAPLIVRFDLGARYAATCALLATQEARATAAAQLLGYGEAAFAAHGLDALDPAERKARDLALGWLSTHAAAGEITQWMREGAQLSDEEAYRVALESKSD